jgi:assimilatory nitrate reductase catalytic subunit
MFRAVADGRIKALWIIATNPVVSMPEAEHVEAAIRSCPFVVVSDVIAETDTVRHAHIRLPATAWGEKDGTVTNSERCITRQRAFLKSSGETRPDWWMICEVAKRMGFGAAFDYASPSEIFAEHAGLSAFENGGSRDFDIGAHANIGTRQYDALQPFQWPHSALGKPTSRLFAEGRYFTTNRKARFVATPSRPNAEFPLTLNTGRIRDHWHTMTRTGKSQRLSQHYGEPFCEIHPDDATDLKIGDADLVRVSSGHGAVLVRALISPRQRRGSIFVPMHWTDQFASKGRVGALVPSVTDPHSGQPASKCVSARIERFVAAKYGFAVLATKPKSIDAEYWAMAKCPGGWRVELGFASNDRDWSAVATKLLYGSPSSQTLAYSDESSGQHRFACYDGPELKGAVFIARDLVAVSRDWAVAQLSAAFPDARARFSVIAGRPGKGGLDKGATVCSCFGVGANEIVAAMARGCATVAAIGQATQAGTNCGSCRAEIRNIVETQRARAAE